MVFSRIHHAVTQRLHQLPASAQTLYLGKNHYGFPANTTLYRHDSTLFYSGLPYKNRSIDFMYAQLHESVGSPFFLHQELLRTCKSAILTFRSPLATSILDLPDEASDLDHMGRFVIWTDMHTNQLCFLPVTSRAWMGLQAQKDKWLQLTQFNPLFFFNIYEFEHAMELNVKFYSAQLDAKEFQEVFQEACHASVQYTQWWLESKCDARGQSP